MAGKSVIIWDLPTRLFHWLLVLVITGAWYTGENELYQQHLVLGLAALGLLVFRIIWGIIGSETARFGGFVRGPAAALEHLRHLAVPGPLTAHAGHNPLGGYAVLGLLGLIALQVGTGLFISGGEEDLVTGPLNSLIGPGSGAEKILVKIHHLGIKLLIVMVAVHVLAVGFYTRVKKLNLLLPMLTGRARLDGPAPRMAPLWWAVLVLVPVLLLVWGLWRLAQG